MPQLAEVVTIKRKTKSVPWNEVEPLLNQVRTATNANLTEVLDALGYSSSSTAATWRDQGWVPARAKYALLGMLAELRVKVETKHERQFTFDELTGLFAALNRWEVPEDARKALIRKIAKEMQE